MSQTLAAQQSIVFADVAGSTRLYDTLGDQKARTAIAECLTVMSQCVSQYQGRVIKTIGDEIMCCFDSAASAVQAVLDMQAAVSVRQFSGVELQIRVGLQHGDVIHENGDVFGDAVNVAARMAGIAKARQIMITDDCLPGLPDAIREQARLVDKAPVKGKAEPILVYEVVWEQEEATQIMQALSLDASQPIKAKQSLQLTLNGSQHVLGEEQGSFMLGRSPDCDVVVPADMASRKHARIEYRRGKFILVDQSTNGTFVKYQDGQTVFLKREEAPLWGDGQIALGSADMDSDPCLLSFQLKE